MKYIDAEKLIAEIEKRAKFHDDAMKACVGLNNIAITHSAGWKEDTELLAIITSLQQEQPKFNVGDLVVSKKNPHLTYRILATSIPNELGKTDYKVEIFTDGKPGLLGESNNIHLISSDKIEDWGELVQQEQPEVDYNKFEKLFDDFCERNKGHHITSHDACMWFWELGFKSRKV